jgi:integrase/recombinase XerD
MLRHTFVTAMPYAGVDLRDVQIAARHADPRTTMRCYRARNNFDQPPQLLFAAYMAPRFQADGHADSRNALTCR